MRHRFTRLAEGIQVVPGRPEGEFENGTSVILKKDREVPGSPWPIPEGTMGNISDYEPEEKKYTVMFLTEKYPYGMSLLLSKDEFEIKELNIDDLKQVAQEIEQVMGD